MQIILGQRFDDLDAHGDTMPNLPLRCRIAHVSERALQYGFLERYGVSPTAFVRIWQLNTARRRLCSPARAGRAVAAVAAPCGFHDPSVFAGHYQGLHRELPSATVTRSVRPDAAG